MNAIKLRLICLVLMCVGLCPRVAMAENDGHSGTYTKIPSVKISTDQEGNSVEIPAESDYTIGLYSFNWNSESQAQPLASNSDSQTQPRKPDAFLFAQHKENSGWWFAVKYKIENRDTCSYYSDVGKGNSYPEVVQQASRLKFFRELDLEPNPKDFEAAQNNITTSLDTNFNVNITNLENHEDSPYTDIKDALNKLFNNCQIFLHDAYFDDEAIEKNAELATLIEQIETLRQSNSVLTTQLQEKKGKLKAAQDNEKKLKKEIAELNAEKEPNTEIGIEGWLKSLRNSEKWLFRALIGLLMIVVIARGFLFCRKIMKSYRADMEQIKSISNDTHNFEKQQVKIEKQQEDILARVQDIDIALTEYIKLKKAPIDNDERMMPNYQNTDAAQAKTLLSAVQTAQKAASEKLAAHIDQQFKNFISQYQSGAQEYNEKLEKSRPDMQTQLAHAKAGQEQERESLLSAVQMAQKAASEKLAAHIDQQFKNFISQNEKHEQLKLDYEKEKDSKLDMQAQLKDAKAGQEQAEDKLDYLKKISARTYQQGGLKLSDEENEDLASERLAELGSLYNKRPTVQQYGLAIDALKNRLGDPALADEPFFKAVGLNVLQAKLSRIHHDFRRFYENDEFSAYLVGHWKDNIQLIFRACLLLESYFQLDMQNPVLIDLRLARNGATKLLWEHGLIPDDFQLPVPSHELERKFEVTVHGDIPADLAAHAGFKDKVQALRRSGAHKVVCYVSRWGLSAQAGAPYTHDLPGTVLKSLERLDPVVQGWGD